MYHQITQKDIPYWYQLSWSKEFSAISIGLHKETVAKLPQINSEAPIVKHYMGEYGFKEFFGTIGAEYKLYGFDGALKFIGEDQDSLNYWLKIPIIKEENNEACKACGGSGTSLYHNAVCFECGGEKTGHKLVFKKANSLCASLSLLFDLLSYKEPNTHNGLKQLMVINTIIQRGMSGAGIGGYYSALLVSYLAGFEPCSRVAKMADAMKEAYATMFIGLGYYSDNDFRASIDYENGWLNVSCPGDACGLNPSREGWKKNKGYSFGCHNVDSPFQQLVLLAGLAGLCDAYREREKKL